MNPQMQKKKASPGSRDKRPDARKSAPPALLDKIIHVGICLTLLTPLCTWSGFLVPQVTAKLFTFQLLVELTGAAALIAIGWGRRQERSYPNVWLSPVFAALGMLLGYTAISAAAGIDPALSLWGFMERQDGLIQVLHFALWSVLLAWFCLRASWHSEPGRDCWPGQGNWRFYLGLSFGVSAAVAVSSLMESRVPFEGVIPPLMQILSSPTRLGFGFGNPMSLGPYLLFHWFFGLYLFRVAASWNPSGGPGRGALRWGAWTLIGAAEILIVIVLIGGQTRGVILGLAAGFLAFMVFLVVAAESERRIKAVAVALAILFGIGLISWWSDPVVARDWRRPSSGA